MVNAAVFEHMTAKWVKVCTATTLLVPQKCGRLLELMAQAVIVGCHLGMINASTAKTTIGRRQ